MNPIGTFNSPHRDRVRRVDAIRVLDRATRPALVDQTGAVLAVEIPGVVRPDKHLAQPKRDGNVELSGVPIVLCHHVTIRDVPAFGELVVDDRPDA